MTKYLHLYQGKRVLVTGGRGFIGAGVAERLSTLDCSLKLLDRSPPSDWHPRGRKANIEFVNADVCELKTWKSVLPETDIVFHLAALEYQRAGFRPFTDLQVNAVSILKMLEACREGGFSPLIVFSSSANLCGGTRDGVGSAEDDPLSVWSAHKLLAENYLKIYGLNHGVDSLVLRIANVYGCCARRDAVDRVTVNGMIKKALIDSELSLYSNCDCERDFIYVDDVAEALLSAGSVTTQVPQRAFGQVFALGSGEKSTYRELAILISDSVYRNTGKRVRIIEDSATKLEPLDYRCFVADSSLFQEATGWSHQLSLAKGVDTTVRWYAGLN